MGFSACCKEKINEKTSKGERKWLCRCECGNEIDVAYNNLVHCNMKSCGCQKKEHDKSLQSFLTHVAGTSVDALKSKKVPMDNTTGYKGVYLIRGKYVAKIVFQKTVIMTACDFRNKTCYSKT